MHHRNQREVQEDSCKVYKLSSCANDKKDTTKPIMKLLYKA